METNGRSSVASNRANERKPPGVLTRTMLASTKVTFGPGVSIDDVVTGFESTSIMLNNIPDTVTQSELVPLCDMIPGKPSATLLSPMKRIRLDFATRSDAQAALDSLRNFNLRGIPLDGHLNISRAQESANFQCRLQLTWSAPFKQFYCDLGSRQAASGAIRSWKDKTIGGCKTRVYRLQTNPSVVCVDGLPIDTGDYLITDLFSNPNGVVNTIGSRDNRIETEALTNLLNPHGLYKLQIQPRKANETLARGWATFLTYEGMIAADKALKANPETTRLNGFSIRSYVSLSASYRIPLAQYRAQGDRWKLDMPDGAKLRTEVGPTHVRIHLQANNEEAMTRSKPLVDRLVRGEVCSEMEKDQPLWESFLVLKEGELFLRTVCGSTNCHVFADKWRKCIRLYGTEEAVATAKSMIIERVKEKRQQRCVHIIDRLVVEAILRAGGLPRLQEKLPSGEIAIDIIGLQVSYIGGDHMLKDLETAIDILHREGMTKRRGGKKEAQLCPICCDEPSDPIRLSCRHTYCNHCLVHYISSAIKSRDFAFPLKCQSQSPEGEPCQQRLPLGLLRRYTSQHENNQLFETAFFAYLNTNPDQFRFCPTPDCPQIYRLPAPSGIRCPSCFTRICTKCNEHYHDGVECGELDNEAAFKSWLKGETRVKPCPKCNAIIEKIDGCNHMCCSLCSTHFCWSCLGIFADIYAHLESVHGGIN